jgi:hypothetical protein
MAVTKTPDTYREDRFTWFMGSEGSVHGCLAPRTRAEHHSSRSMWQTMFFASWRTGSRKGGRNRGLHIIFKGTLSVTSN